jgi:hypothetical protein
MKIDWVICNIVGLVVGVVCGISFFLYLYSVFVLG